MLLIILVIQIVIISLLSCLNDANTRHSHAHPFVCVDIHLQRRVMMHDSAFQQVGKLLEEWDIILLVGIV